MCQGINYMGEGRGERDLNDVAGIYCLLSTGSKNVQILLRPNELMYVMLGYTYKLHLECFAVLCQCTYLSYVDL